MKNLVSFCPSSKNFCEAELKSNGLIHFVEEISIQPTMTRESYGENVEGEGCRRGGHWLFLGVSKKW